MVSSQGIIYILTFIDTLQNQNQLDDIELHCQPPHDEVEGTLLTYLRVREE